MTTGRDPMTTSGTTDPALDPKATSASSARKAGSTSTSRTTSADASTATRTDRPMVGVMGETSDDPLAQTAGDIAGRVSGTLSEQANARTDDQLTRAGDMLDQVAGAVRRSGEDLRAEQPQVAGMAGTAADQVEKAAQFLREADLDRIVGEVESFARRQPAVFVGAAVALGFTASRFLKASSPGMSSGYRSSAYGRSGYGYGYGSGSGYGTSYGGSSYGGSSYGGSSYGGSSYGAGTASGSGGTDRTGTGTTGTTASTVRSSGSSGSRTRTADPRPDEAAGEQGYERA